MLSKPVIATLHRRHYSHYPQFMVSFGIPLETQICNILHFIFRMIFSSQVHFQNEISARHLRHTGGKGGTGRHLGGIWDHPGGSGRHLGGIWEASERHLGLQAAMGLQEAPNHKNRCPSQLKCKSLSESESGRHPPEC